MGFSLGEIILLPPLFPLPSPPPTLLLLLLPSPSFPPPSSSALIYLFLSPCHDYFKVYTFCGFSIMLKLNYYEL